jgi:hypothetical protein
MDMEIFQNTYLSKEERKILKMLLSGYTVDEIRHECQLFKYELEEFCENIGKRWEEFNLTDSVA